MFFLLWGKKGMAGDHIRLALIITLSHVKFVEGWVGPVYLLGSWSKITCVCVLTQKPRLPFLSFGMEDYPCFEVLNHHFELTHDA